MLVAKGFGKAYKVGPGLPMGPADVTNCAAFQRAQGWSGSDADGYPGPETWARLSAAAPPPPPPPPADTRPWISLSNVVDSARRDGPAPQGSAAHRSDVLPVEQALVKVGLNPGPVDGSFGTMCKSAYAAWQRSLGYSGKDADGIPGLSSLQTLGDRTGLFRVAG
jgi:peptidoglycan hydrolase-like protein with peptidoglycan-binding domain